MNNLKATRMEHGLTVRELSDLSNVATGYISVIENDNSNKTNPTRETMEKIAKALNTTVAELFFNTEKETNND